MQSIVIPILLATFLVHWGPNRSFAQEQLIDSVGRIEGRIAIDGDPVELPKLRVPSEKSPRLRQQASEEERTAYQATLIEIEDESFQIDQDRGLANVFVYLAKAPSPWQPRKEEQQPFEFTLQLHRIEPRAALVRTGQDIRLNSTVVEPENFGYEPLKNDPQNRMVYGKSGVTIKHPFTSQNESRF